MFRKIILFASLLSLPCASNAFAAPSFSQHGTISLSASLMSNDLGSSTNAKENYDVVKVDLDDGRDYPIYIGTGYSDEEGVFILFFEKFLPPPLPLTSYQCSTLTLFAGDHVLFCFY